MSAEPLTTPPLDLDGMRHAAREDEQHGHHLQAGYLRAGADEIERLREALIRLRDCDFIITPADRMDAVRRIAREALDP